MAIQIDGQGMEVTPALRELTLKKLSRIETHIDNIQHIHIIFKVNKIRQIADGTISIPGATINAQAESEDMYKTIDLLIEKLLKQLIKHKEKETDHR